MSQSSEWVYDYAHRAYFHTASQVYATIDPLTGQWQYLEAQTVRRPHVPIDDGGWGATLEDESGSTKRPEQHSSASNQQPIRLVVRDSTVLVKGQVALIDDREGGVQVGRDHCQAGAPPRLRVKEMEVSKTHAVFFHDSGAWFVVDSGSTQGTFVGGHRLSEAKIASKPHPLSHGVDVTIGNTTFVAHIHPSWPCQDCQLTGDNEIRLDDGAALKPVEAPNASPTSSAPYAMDSQERRDNRENRRKREMAALRANLLNT